MLINSNFIKRTIFPTMAMIGLLFLFACGTDAPASQVTEGENVNTEGTTPINTIPNPGDPSKYFVLAWLADCVNDKIMVISPESAVHDSTIAVQNEAHGFIQGAISNGSLQKIIGQQSLADGWGPVVRLEPTWTKPYYAVSNLMYCLKSTDQESGDLHYTVGISGTDAISTFDWFTEDLAADTLSTWPQGGKVSNGSLRGYNILKDLINERGASLLVFLQNEVLSNPGKSISVSVTGHSLGGAMTQVYSSYIRANLDSQVNVKAWVYAGPTAGNQLFASNLVRQLSGQYYAYNNKLDAIPHAWASSQLNELCGLYDGKKACTDGIVIGANPLINGVIKYLRNISASGQYTMPPGQLTRFDPPKDYYIECKDLDTFTSKLKSTFNTQLGRIVSNCSSRTINDNDYQTFASYFTEMGLQHTSAYLDHFVQDTAQQNIISEYFYHLNAQDKTINEEAAGIVLEFFIMNASSLPLKDCDCSTTSN